MKPSRFFRFLPVLICAASLLACAAPSVPRNAVFSEAEFARSRRSGNSSISGQAYITMKDNSTKAGADAAVILFPVNAYTTETIQRKYEKGENLADGDPRYYQYLRAARADGEGNFSFRQIPAGDYYVGTDVGWSYWIWNTNGDGSTYKSTIRRSTRIYARVSVGEGRAARVTEWSQGKSRLLNGLLEN